ncbi:glycosyltransferase family 2 protein [Desulfobacter latus]|uniref:Glycosyltransferase family 2 protein n=1 Tax=Desulfobacter latus TaxID=2292 RepID=A0A850T1Q9_9BACT|nr:glycosyltransferase family 2 protein [Desulfobacter latus]NWH05031.1 glycosyltransferase family 2 protein [Desulfobacter latus]
MSQESLVSVIIPTYNREHCIKRAIYSVLNQNYKNTEIIVIDDCSQDKTEQRVFECTKECNNIVYYRNVKNEGCAISRNIGVELSNGEYIAFLDDDDEYYPEKLSSHINVLNDYKSNNMDYDVLISGVSSYWIESKQKKGLDHRFAHYAKLYALFKGKCKQIQHVDPNSVQHNLKVGPNDDQGQKKDWIDIEFFPHRLFASCNTLIKSSVFGKVSFRCDFMEWRDLAFQIYQAGFKVLLTNKSYVKENSLPVSQSKKYEAMLLQALENAQLYSVLTGDNKKAIFKKYLANCFKSYANYKLKQSCFKSALQNYIQSFQVDKNVKNLIPFL